MWTRSVVAQAARVVRAFDRFEAARAKVSRQRRGAALEVELRVLKQVLNQQQPGDCNPESSACPR
jgi:hypothetical protein